MADRDSLRFIGMIYGGLAAAVILVAGFVVTGHMLGRLQLDPAAMPVVKISASLR